MKKDREPATFRTLKKGDTFSLWPEPDSEDYLSIYIKNSLGKATCMDTGHVFEFTPDNHVYLVDVLIKYEFMT